MKNRLLYLIINIIEIIIFVVFLAIVVIQFIAFIWIPFWIITGKWLFNYLSDLYEGLYPFKTIKIYLEKNNYSFLL